MFYQVPTQRGRRFIVTGSNSGTGRETARRLALAGAEVILAARREERLKALAQRLCETGRRCSVLALDVCDPASVESAAATLARVDVLINNAGVVIEGTALDQDEASWDTVLDTNLKGMFLLARAVCRALRTRAAGGAIVNIASILGLRQAGGVLPYAVSKAGVIQLTKVLALEVARYGIRVNALAPGYVDTDLNRGFWDSEAGKAMLRRIPQRRLSALTDLDGPLLLLASEAGAYMTGSVLVVDGGHCVSTL